VVWKGAITFSSLHPFVRYTSGDFSQSLQFS
jgi:hypothetical protein